MKLPDMDEGSGGMSPSLIAVLITTILFLILIIGLIGIANRPVDEKPQDVIGGSETGDELETEYPDTYEVIGDSGLTVDDLDFWDMYPRETLRPVTVESEEEPEATPFTDPDPATDGKHTKIKGKDGKEEWILINPYLDRNSYDLTQFRKQSGVMKYYEDDRAVSFFGLDLSKTQGYVDFVKLKKEGVDFVMLRLGARGYESGQIILDEYFTDNMKRATDAGLEVGVYFFSQAISAEEIAEEVEFVLANLEGRTIHYPVAFDMEYISNDSCRIESVSKGDKTVLARAFMDLMKEQGYHTVLYGNKEWLLKEVDLTKLTGYDVWLSQSEELPDYPYEYTMWQYNRSGEIDGVNGTVNFNISFVDYAEK